MKKLALLIFLCLFNLQAMEIEDLQKNNHFIDLGDDFSLSISKSTLGNLSIDSTSQFRLTIEDSDVSFNKNHGSFYTLTSEFSTLDGVEIIGKTIKDLVFIESKISNLEIRNAKISTLIFDGGNFLNTNLDNVKIKELKLSADMLGDFSFKKRCQQSILFTLFRS